MKIMNTEDIRTIPMRGSVTKLSFYIIPDGLEFDDAVAEVNSYSNPTAARSFDM